MSNLLDMAVFPGTQGGPLEHIIAAKAISFGEVLSDEFTVYSKQIISNAKAMNAALVKRGYDIVSGGTDNHRFLCLRSWCGIYFCHAIQPPGAPWFTGEIY